MAVVELGHENIDRDEADRHTAAIVEEIMTGKCDGTAVIAIKGSEISISCTGYPELLANAFEAIVRSFRTRSFQQERKPNVGELFKFEDGRNEVLNAYMDAHKTTQ